MQTTTTQKRTRTHREKGHPSNAGMYLLVVVLFAMLVGIQLKAGVTLTQIWHEPALLIQNLTN